MAIEKRQFLFGMDQDSDDRYIQPGFTRKNVNVRVGSSVSDGNGTGENISGNTLIPNLDLPAGDNKVIGSYWYKKKDLNYFFVWNENGDHGIYEYNHVSSHISTVMIAEVLGFSKDGLITGINVVEFDDDNDLLYWSALSINPSKINIQKAKSGGYTLPIKKEIIDAIKYPPLCPIEAHYEVDANQKVNYLEDKIVQVKARYIYDDKEKSAFSPISVNILPISSCSGNSSGNTIRIIVPPGGELVERIEIAARFSNISSFYKIVDQPIGDYIVNTTTGNYEYIFNNDAKYDIVSQAESDNLFDRIPQIAGAQEFIAGNRIAYGDITENYDNVPIEVNLDVKYQPKVSTKTNTISGEVTIRNNNESGDYRKYQPIHNTGGVNVFGGFNSLTFKNPNNYLQQIPLGGFVVYLAGTDYFAVSEQIIGNNSQIQTDGVYDSSSSSNRRKIRDEIEGASVGTFPSTRTYSTWSIPNVPDGTYVLRVASHLTTQADLDSGTRVYQKTSTYLNTINNVSVQEEVITVSGGQVFSGVHIEIEDLTDPGAANDSTALSGYLVDPSDKNSPPTSISQLLAETRIDQAFVQVRYKDSSKVSYEYTDHNGFFYSSNSKFNANTNIGELIDIQSGIYSDNSFKTYNIFSTGTPTNTPLTPDNSASIGVYANTSNDITNFSRTNISYNILDTNNKGVDDVYCVLTGGDVQQTDSLGNVNFISYARTRSGLANNSRSGDFYFYPKSSSCLIDFVPKSLSFNIFIGQLSENNSTTVLLADVLATLLNNTSASYLKRGASYDYGLLYYDRANRSGQVNISSSSNLLIPFYTEQTGSPAVALPDSAPLVEWEIKHAPPSWATHYQWVRTKNTFSNRYIQWAAKDVSYLDDAGVSSNFNDGTQIAIDITNLSSDYISAHPDSVLSYDYSPGDRIRFIKDSNGNLFTDYFDIKITSFAAGILTMEKLNALPLLSEGCLFEIYSPKLELDEDIYYEIGECFEVQETILNGKKYYSHKGLVNADDQSPFALSTKPATGTFRSGDTFYRGRTIPVTSGRKNYTIDSSRFSDFFESSVSDIGRPALEDQDASSAHRPTTIYYTQRFIPETNINGLNTVYSSSFETYDRNNGAIRKLFSINNRLDCYQELKVSKILVQENVVYDQFDKGTVGVSESVLSNPSVPYQGEYGTMNPESFAEEGGRRYFFDVRNGAVLRLSNDGLTTISDKQMHSYFESKSNFYSSFDQIPEIWGVFDENHDEYVLNFGSISRDKGFSPQDLALVSSQAEVVTETRNGLQYSFVIGYSENDDGVPTQFEIIRDVSNGTYVINSSAGSIDMDRQKILTIPSETVAFSERTGYWDSFYSYLPECMCRVGIDFLSFKKGKAFLHNSNNLRNNFYGVRFPSELWVVFNQAPSNNKVFNSLGVESTTIWEAREILTDSGQKSQLIESDFQDDQGQGLIFDAKENIHYAALMQDENTPNVQFPLINGDDMRDVSILFKLTKDTDDLERIFSANINFALSQRSNK